MFMNIGKFYGTNDGTAGAEPFDLFPLPQAFVKQYHVATPQLGKLPLKHLRDELWPYHGDLGIEQVAIALGVAQPISATEREPPAGVSPPRPRHHTGSRSGTMSAYL